MIKCFMAWASGNARRRRAKIFWDYLRPTAEDRIVDLGGGTGRYIADIVPFRDNIMIADISTSDLDQAAQLGFSTLVLGEELSLPFDDQSVDVMFCSSVIEHATGPKEQTIHNRDGKAFARLADRHQRALAEEIRRSARRYFVQTPYKYFPLESHTWFPVIIVVLPRRLQVDLIKLLNGFWPKKTSGDWRLLTVADMRHLFPDAEIVLERFCGLTKSIMAVKR